MSRSQTSLDGRSRQAVEAAGSVLTPELDQLTYELIGIAMLIHTTFGPGLRENVYEEAYVIALENRDIDYVRQMPFAIRFEGQSLRPIRLDLVVKEQVVVELKAVSQLHDVHTSQMLTYLKLTGLAVGLIINFNVRHLRSGGIRRHVRGVPFKGE